MQASSSCFPSMKKDLKVCSRQNTCSVIFSPSEKLHFTDSTFEDLIFCWHFFNILTQQLNCYHILWYILSKFEPLDWLCWGERLPWNDGSAFSPILLIFWTHRWPKISVEIKNITLSILIRFLFLSRIYLYLAFIF